MATEGPKYPTGITETGAGLSWTTPSAAANAPNDTGALVSPTTGTTKKLQGTPNGLGFNIPAGSTIRGIYITTYTRGGNMV